MGIAAEHINNIGLGTNVAIAFPLSPMATAQVAWDLQHLSGGRFQLSLKTQVKGHIQRRYATPWTSAPGPRLKEYVQCLQAMFKTFQNPGDPCYFEGEHYQYTLMSPFLALGADEEGVEKAKEALKQQVSFSASTRSYHNVLRYHGSDDLGPRLHELSLQGKWTELPKQITGDMLEEWAIVAAYDESPTKLRERAKGAYTSVLLDLPGALKADEDRVADIVKQLHES